jgi:hypothetical protein
VAVGWADLHGAAEPCRAFLTHDNTQHEHPAGCRQRRGICSPVEGISKPPKLPVCEQSAARSSRRQQSCLRIVGQSESFNSYRSPRPGK